MLVSILRIERFFKVQYPGGVHRSMEDIKARYYAVARQLLVGREGTEDSVANNVLVKHPFNLTHERCCCFFARQQMQSSTRDHCICSTEDDMALIQHLSSMSISMFCFCGLSGDVQLDLPL